MNEKLYLKTSAKYLILLRNTSDQINYRFALKSSVALNFINSEICMILVATFYCIFQNKLVCFPLKLAVLFLLTTNSALRKVCYLSEAGCYIKMQLYTPVVNSKHLQGMLVIFYDFFVLPGMFQVFSDLA